MYQQLSGNCWFLCEYFNLHQVNSFQQFPCGDVTSWPPKWGCAVRISRKCPKVSLSIRLSSSQPHLLAAAASSATSPCWDDDESHALTMAQAIANNFLAPRIGPFGILGIPKGMATARSTEVWDGVSIPLLFIIRLLTVAGGFPKSLCHRTHTAAAA